MRQFTQNPNIAGQPRLADLLHVTHPARYLGGERGSIVKDRATVDLTFALAFPDVYEVGMSHVGSAILYKVLNDLPWLAAERAYAPWPDREAQLRAAGEPLASLESGQALASFDIVGFSLQYELSYTNVLTMLDLAGIPRRAAARDDRHPLVVVGGPCALNPEPLAAFIDCAVLGDGEEAVAELCAAVRAARAAGLGRPELLQALARIPGLYVPAFYEVSYRSDGRVAAITARPPAPPAVRRRIVADLDAAPYPDEPIVPLLQTIHDRVAMEVARGCTRGCRFCQAGYLYRPVRERQPDTLRRLIDAALQRSGYDEVSLLSLSTGDYTAIEPLLQNLMGCYADHKVAVSLPSLRVGSLTPALMEEIKKVRKTGFTLAPEAGSERLRQVINKGITEDDLLATSKTAFTLGWRIIKLYFMMGLPTETDEDLAALVDLAARVKATGRGTAGGADVNVSVSNFVPKAHTPFQWEPQLDREQIRARQEFLREALKKRRLRLKWHEAELSVLEGVFARGDRRLAPLLERAVDLGCRFDGWRDHFRWDLWQQALAETGIDPAFYLRARQSGEILPWDHIDAGVSKAFLLRERQNALLGRATADCRFGQCCACGVCDFEKIRPRLADRQRLPAPAAVPAAGGGEPAADLPKLRLTVRKGERAAALSHLEFMTVIQRAVRRAGIPVRWSAGFHPAPRIGFGDALPLGVTSEAELVDLDLAAPMTAAEAMAALNRELPAGIAVLAAQPVSRREPSAAASLATARYRVPLPARGPADLPARLAAFLAADSIAVERLKKGRPLRIDLRPWVVALELDAASLWLTLHGGSPLPVAAYLLGLPVEEVRALGVCKTAVTLHEAAPDCEGGADG
ncbi:MAG: TIGR03960 family B12-binding radical SAM protein [Deltaproteobacteria bacterium]|nr:MAG: TIGR03960 family B12-binding radical SAM protein [Deltaproteobacteria bacterium]